MTRQSTIDVKLSLQRILDGLEKHAQGATFVLGGVKYTTAALTKLVRAALAAIQEVAPARAAYQGAVGRANKRMKALSPVIRDLRHVLQIQFANDHTTLSDYGLEPRRVPGPKTPNVKAAAAEKGRQTRKARGTMGPKQKKRIKGAPPPPTPKG